MSKRSSIEKKASEVSASETVSAEDKEVQQTELHEQHCIELPKKLKWKIDLRILPFFMIAYFLQFLDKTLLNYAAVMGIKKHLHGDDYSNLSTMFYVGFLAAEPLAGYLIQKFPIAKFLGVMIFIWGAIVCFHAATKSYAALMVIRTLLGIFESATAACLIPIMGMYYTKAEQTRRTALWYMQTGVAGIVGSLLSYGFQHVHSTKIENWQILFIFMGILTCIMGIFTFLYLPDDPSVCKFLTEEEKNMIIDHIKENQTGLQNREFKKYQVKELLLKDNQTWLLFIMCLLSSILGTAFTTFSTTIINNFGFTDLESTFMQFPAGFVSIFATLICCYVPSYLGERLFIMFFFYVVAIVGLALQISLGKHQKVGGLIGVYMMKANGATLSLVYNLGAINTSGYTKRLTRNTLTLIAFCIGSLVAPQHFRDTDAPDYTKAKTALISEMAVCSVVCLGLRLVLQLENRKRVKEAKSLVEPEIHREALFLDITDIENRNFRYEY